jgi:Phospholipase_D-nuclease N-terminal
MTLEQLLPILLPLLALQLLLIVVALRDLVRPDRRVRGGRKLPWGLVIVLGELVGPLVYLAVGRLDE